MGVGVCLPFEGVDALSSLSSEVGIWRSLGIYSSSSIIHVSQLFQGLILSITVGAFNS